MAAIAWWLACSSLMSWVSTPIACAIRAKRRVACGRLYSSITGSKIALQTPWGRLCVAPGWWASAWTKPSPALLNAIPAKYCPHAIISRACRFLPSATANGNHWLIRRIDSSAEWSVNVCAPNETYASTAWVRASIPVAAVTLAGILSITEGSSTAISGMRLVSIITSFTCRWLSIITALLVNSAAVPAVVLMAINGTPVCLTLPTPE